MNASEEPEKGTDELDLGTLQVPHQLNVGTTITEINISDGSITLSLSEAIHDDVDKYTGETVDTVLKNKDKHDISTVVFDLSELEKSSSLLLGRFNVLRSRGIKVVLTHPNKLVDAALKGTRLDTLFTVIRGETAPPTPQTQS